MKTLVRRIHVAAVNRMYASRGGMELVQVAILVAIAILIGLIFRSNIKTFVQDVFAKLSVGSFS
ncbi:MAG: hypothetical protein LBG82_07740 [Clostridiales Family XIII bacterium]|jgi:hypothetical protein|nr:hypothetical protein [Clostridiales Family XIII bacterium]